MEPEEFDSNAALAGVASMETPRVPIAEPIAIVGMGCRWPGTAVNPSKFWELMMEKRSAHSDFPANRFNIDAYYHPNRSRPGSLTTKGGYFIQDDPKLFDPAFFGINSVEAMTLDPAQRKILEVVYEALESAGATLESISGTNTGCFMGNFNHDHLFGEVRDSEYTKPYTATSAIAPFLSNRVSYVFNLTGPSMTVDTACSASLYALHLACLSLQSGESSAALVGSSNLILSPDMQIFLDKLGALSPTSQCHTFDASGDGYGRADGFGVFYLKRLSDAVRDRDPIRSVIRATAVNANGKNSGITHPSAAAQEAAMRYAYARAGTLDPDMTGYYECHGTGTPVGDPLELSAISRVFSKGRTLDKPLLIGSVKTNVGHSEPTSGLAGLMKAVLAIEKNIIPPTTGVTNLNPRIDFNANKFKIVTESTAWPSHIPVRRASVASSGFGGANAHVILEGVESFIPNYKHGQRLVDSGEKPVSSEIPPEYLLPFSAHDKDSLENNIEALRNVASEYSIADLSYTLGARRSRFLHKAFAVSDQDSLSTSLEANNVTHASTVIQEPSSLGFIFTGQGAQWAGMGKELIFRFPIFKQTIETLDDILQSLDEPPSWKFLDLLQEPKETSRVNNADISQPICTALQIGLVELLASWNIEPVATMGHSSGELGAAYASGIITGEEAIVAAYYRGKAVTKITKKGSMAAIGLGRDAIEPRLSNYDGIVKVAAVNSPEGVTISGDPETIDQITKDVSAEGVFARVLQTGGKAYHSPHMKEVSEYYESATSNGLKQIANDRVRLQRPLKTFFSSVYGKRFQGDGLDAAYWRENLENPVLFTTALEDLVSTPDVPVDMLVEVGPHSALAGPIRQLESLLKSKGKKFPGYSSVLTRGKDAVTCALSLAGTLFTRCVDINFDEINAVRDQKTGSQRKGHVIPDLPTYRYQYKDIFWHENRIHREVKERKFLRHDLLGSRIPGCSPRSPSWRNIITVQDVPWLEDCKVRGTTTLSPACFLVMAMEAVKQMFSEKEGNERISGYHFPAVTFEDPVLLGVSASDTELVISLHEQGSSQSRFSQAFEIVSIADGRTTVHCSGLVSIQSQNISTKSQVNMAETPKPVSADAWYSRFASLGLEYGPAFQAMSFLRTNPVGNKAGAQIALLPSTGRPIGESSYEVHPTAIDACIQLGLIAAKRGEPRNAHNLVRPITLSRLSIPVSSEAIEDIDGSAMAWGKQTDTGNLEARVQLISSSGKVVMDIGNVVAEPVKSSRQAENAGATPFTHPVWKADYTRLLPERAREMFPPVSFEAAEAFEKIDQASIAILVQFVSKIAPNVDRSELDIGLVRFWDWMHATVKKAESGEIAYGKEALALSPSSRDTLIDKICTEVGPVAVEAQLMHRMYQNMERIFNNEASAHEVLMEGELLPKLYTNSATASGSMVQLRRVIDLIGHKSPAANYLEIGGGTGGATREILAVLNGKDPVRRYGSYTFTDVSSFFLSGAREEFKEYGGMKYATIDIERDVSDQGFEKGSMDVIIAANVLHATTVMKETLTHVRSLLKPGGKLVLVETTIEPIWLAIVLGGFQDYWKGHTDGRPNSPFMTVAKWETILKETGFTRPAIELDDYIQPSQFMNVMVSTAIEPEPVNSVSKDKADEALTLVYRDQTVALASEVENLAKEQSISINVVSLSELGDVSGQVIMLAELERPLFPDMNETEFTNLKKLSDNAKSIVWVTPSGFQPEDSPKSVLVTGFAQAIKAQNPTLPFVVLRLDIKGGEESQLAKLILSEGLSAPAETETELTYLDGLIQIKRILPTAPPAIKSTAKARYADDIAEILTNRIDTSKPLEPEEIEFDLKTVALKHSGSADGVPGFSLTGECTGTVTRVGSRILGLHKGDNVFALARGGWQSKMRVSRDLIKLLRPGEILEKVTTMPIAYCSALYLIKHIAKVSAGDNLLLHILDEDIALAMSTIAKLKGAKVFASIGPNQSSEAVARELQIPVENVLKPDEGSFVNDALQLTKEKGFDIIVAHESQGYVDELSAMVSPLGFVVRIAAEKDQGRQLWHRQRDQNWALVSLDMDLIVSKKPKVFSSLLAETLSLYREGVIQFPSPASVLPMSAIRDESFPEMDAVKFGKSVLRIDQSAQETALPHAWTLKCSPHESYILIGCLESHLGREIGMWLAEKGAKDLVFISQPQTVSTHASGIDDYSKQLADLGVSLSFVESSMTKPNDVDLLKVKFRKSIGGIIQGPANLEDESLDGLDHAQYQKAFRSQSYQLRRLHELVKEGPPPRFITLLGSIKSVLGDSGLTLNPLIDTLRESIARQWRSQGFNARFIALGPVQEEGDNAEVGLATRPIDEVLELLEAAIVDGIPDKANESEEFEALAEPSSLLLGLDPSKAKLPVESDTDAGEDVPWSQNIAVSAMIRALQSSSENAEQSTESVPVGEVLSTIDKNDQRYVEVAMDAIVDTMAKLLFVAREQISVKKALASYGLDSMIASQLRTFFAASFGLNVALNELMSQDTTIDALAGKVQAA
ncbi:hypothetical protein L228DRAFT_218919 [Xylona heveae TC161]|uniref:Uncharacterized protein n=1 Tax=Xylona heveae (strain CBS 132557 / TC161) TaxID=1328760 RepID=A0A165I743_XYLHT|nr:hypothetical protein L228DRAFT_218919 [Xylona heveae TC161]KZF24488.1 hypothetical protein L228DRAFT_218919 [Xylona heveae TC161]